VHEIVTEAQEHVPHPTGAMSLLSRMPQSVRGAMTGILLAGALESGAASAQDGSAAPMTMQTATDTMQDAEKSETEMIKELTTVLTDRFHYRTLMLWTQPPKQDEIERLKTDVGRVFGLKHNEFLMTVLYPKDGRVTVMIHDPSQELKPIAVFVKERLQDVREFKRQPKLTELDSAQLNIVSRRALDLKSRMGTRRTVAEAMETQDGIIVTVMDAETRKPIGKIIHKGEDQEMSVDEDAMLALLQKEK
jgi:hypothetical protein